MKDHIYVISDLHGHYDLFIKLLKKIEFGDNDQLYILGDVIDRGDNGILILDYIWRHKNIILLKGNHEQMMQECLKMMIKYNNLDYDGIEYLMWIKNGGDATIENIRTYLKKDKLDNNTYQIIRLAFCKYLYNYLSNLPTLIELNVNNKDYILVHAGINPKYNLDNQLLIDKLWIREEFYQAPLDINKIYIFGHTPTALLNPNFDYGIWYDNKYHNKMGIDGGLASKNGQINCVCLDDDRIIICK